MHAVDHPERFGHIDRGSNGEPAFTENRRRLSLRIGAVADDEDERSGPGLIVWPAASACRLAPVTLRTPF